MKTPIGLDVNLKGYARVARAVVPAMKARGGGKIINMASIAGLRAAPMMGLYGISKAGVLMMTQVLANELAADNIQVNAHRPRVRQDQVQRRDLEQSPDRGAPAQGHPSGPYRHRGGGDGHRSLSSVGGLKLHDRRHFRD
jgi:NAD(P)-dependent dehydrogenase (short-subunit alcohol dehydrogenase family)